MARQKTTKPTVFHFQPFSQKQRQVLNWWTEQSPVHGADGIIADGAIRSGKTISMSLSFVIWAMDRFHDQNFALCGKTIGSFRRNVLFWLKLMLRSRGYYVADHRADNLITVQFGKTLNYFYIFGGKDERSQDLIQGITLAGVFFDEVALMPESFVNQATGRCSVEGSKFWFNCNPDGPAHWFKLGWIDKAQEKRLLYLHFTMDDNLSLAEEIKQRYRSMYAGVFYRRYIQGLWAMAEGLIYDMFDPDKHVISDDAQLDAIEKTTPAYYVSCDYGTQNATVFLLWAKDVTTGAWVAVDEYYYSGRDAAKQKTNSEYAADLKALLAGRRAAYIIIDPSAASFIEELRRNGYSISKANNDVLEGIRETATWILTGKLYISYKCKNTLIEIGSYAWDEKACERGEDRPIKVRDHAMDAMRYFVATMQKKQVRIRDKHALGIR